MFTDNDSSDVVAPMVRDPLLNTDAACAYLGVPKATLLTWRVRRPGYGPRAVKAGGRLKYRLSELDRWLGSHVESFTEQEPSTPKPPSRPVRTRNRASRLRTSALQPSRPDGVG